MRLLIIEDEETIALPLKKALEKKGYAVDYENNGKSGLNTALINEYDCILLDLNLPEMDGIKIAQKLKEEKISTPILMLTARSQQFEKVEGFKAGTDDYVTKPFHFEELLLRIQALIRLTGKEKSVVLEHNNIKLKPESAEVIVSDTSISLNNKEFGILEYLLRNKGRIVSQEELLEHVWDREIDTFTQTVKTNIKTLRKKVDPDKTIIKTIRGKGYIVSSE